MGRLFFYFKSMIPDRSELYELGYFTKLHGYKGELSAFLHTENMEFYEEVENIFVEIKGQLVPYFVELIETKTKNTVKIKLEGVDSEELAKALVKCRFYIPLDEISEGDESKLELRSIVGFNVFDEEKGALGVVSGILELSGNPQLEIKFEKKTILLPLQPEFIKSIDGDKKEVHIAAPPGLIDLYL